MKVKVLKNSFFVLLAVFCLSFQWSCAPQSTASDSTEEKIESRNIKSENAEDVKQEIKAKVDDVSEKVMLQADVVDLNLPKDITSTQLVNLMWEASSKRQMDRLGGLLHYCRANWKNKALRLQKGLKDFPSIKKIKDYQILTDVGTCEFIYAEALMNGGDTPGAIKAFEEIIEVYPYSQAWEPKGWYWSVAEKSQASINVMTGNVTRDVEEKKPQLRTRPKLAKPGTQKVIDYSKYGSFENIGTEKYKYKIKKMRELKKAVGEGIYPDARSAFQNPARKKVSSSGRLKGTHWDYVLTDDLEAAFFKWTSASEHPGVKLYYVGLIFEKSEMYYEALKAYHALVVHYPKTIAWTYWKTPWYPAQAAIAKIKHIIRINPELGLDYLPMSIQVKNGNDNTVDNDIFITDPGKIVVLDEATEEELEIIAKRDQMIDLGEPVKVTGGSKVKLKQYANGHWKLFVGEKHFPIQAVTYQSTKIGQSPDKGTLTNWMFDDINENGKIDGIYDSWVDKNGNNKQDEDEPVVGDLTLMKEMGVNAIRVYHVPDTPNKALLNKMYKEAGIMVIMSDFLGKYAIGSGASWAEGTDYENPEHKKNMMESVKKMVMENKDEPYVLMWLLGNENNYGVACNADKKPVAFFKFVNEVAKMIKELDPTRPVAVNNGDTLYLDEFAKHAPDVDIYTANAYRGDYGFGSFWEQVRQSADKPAFIVEYGSPAYAPHLSYEESKKAQADYHQGNWMDIAENMAGHPRGQGNALGGVIFQWMDEWWKNYEPYFHDRTSDAIGPFPGGYYFEEWFGIIGQGEGKHSPFMRELRDSYFLYKEMWNQ